MWFCIVGDLVAGPRREEKFSAIGQLGMELTLQAEQDMSFCTPMIGKVAGTIFDEADTDILKLLCAPECHACLPLVL